MEWYSAPTQYGMSHTDERERERERTTDGAWSSDPDGEGGHTSLVSSLSKSVASYCPILC